MGKHYAGESLKARVEQPRLAQTTEILGTELLTHVEFDTLLFFHPLQ